MKKIIFLILSTIICICLLCSCTQTKIQSISDELKSKAWEGKGEYMTTINLEFNDNNAKVEILSYGGAKTIIKGQCIVSDKDFNITDNKLHKNFIFTYKLEGDTLILNYDNNKMKMHAYKH